jgi:RNA polymerase sigma factor (sigma-70 family)
MEAMTGDAARVPVDGTPGAGLRLFGDNRLARLATDGDQRALAAIYRRHHQDLYRYCRAILRDPDEAQDALQATMVKAVSALPGETRSIALKPWLFRVAHNEAISILRARRPSAALDAEHEALGADVERQAEDRDRLRQLVRDLDRLPDRQRGALVMRELSGLSFEDIGEALGLGPDAAKQAVYEARVSLQEMAAGRDMDCGAVRQAISARDRRTLRSRRIRAHMHGCERCTDFAAGIDARRKDLAALAPPIALPAALAALHGALGGGAAGVGSIGGFGGALGGTAAAKTAAAVIAATAIAGGAAGVTGVVHLGGPGDDHATNSASSSRPATHRSPARTERAAAPGQDAVARPDRGAADAGARSHRQGADAGPPTHSHHHNGESAPQSAAAGQPPAHSAAPSTPPGQTHSSPGEATSNAAQGRSQAHGKPTTSQSAVHNNPQAQVQSSSVSHSQADAPTHGDGGASALGQAATTAPGPKADSTATLLDEN